ncbi:MAG: hypothetical protein LBI13_06120 [Streptococcaceae bacterium]|jgi:hypothetical protein|nr:hypothetical protein [Streptococcaceae bacterium]
MVVYDSGDSDILIQAMTTNLNSAKAIFNRLCRGSVHLIEVINSGVLSGAAYTAGKELFVTYINPMLQKLSQAISDIESDLEAYRSADNMVRQYENHLDEALLKKQLNATKELIRLLQQKIDDDEDLMKNLQAAASGDFSKIAANMAEIPGLQEQLDNLEQVKTMYEQELVALATFVSSTTPLFTDSLQAFKYAMQGVDIINQSRANFDGQITFPAGADMSWSSHLTGEKFSSKLDFDTTNSKLNTKGMNSKESAEYKDSVTTVLTNLEEQGWSSEALKAYVAYINKVAGKYKGLDLSKYMLGVVPATGSILGLFDSQGISSADDVNTKVLSVSDILKDAAPGEKTAGKTEQWEKSGSYEEAKNDFDSLQPQNVKPFTNVKNGITGEAGTLSDGQYVIVRTGSSDTRPTLQIQKEVGGKGQFEIRYGEKVSDSFDLPKTPEIPDISEEPTVSEIPAIPDEPITPDEPVDPDIPFDYSLNQE